MHCQGASGTSLSPSPHPTTAVALNPRQGAAGVRVQCIPYSFMGWGWAAPRCFWWASQRPSLQSIGLFSFSYPQPSYQDVPTTFQTLETPSAAFRSGELTGRGDAGLISPDTPSPASSCRKPQSRGWPRVGMGGERWAGRGSWQPSSQKKHARALHSEEGPQDTHEDPQTPASVAMPGVPPQSAPCLG